jgi:hypothetical protein
MDYSVTASTVWRLLEHYMLKRTVEVMRGVQSDSGQTPVFLTGPDTMNKAPREKVSEFAAASWLQGRLQLHHLARANGFHYFHFLQPSQYVPNSKPLNAEEKAKAYARKSEESDFATVRDVYPLLMANLGKLREAGVNAYSLTDMFKDNKGTIYIDIVGHMNQKGNNMLADAMVRQIEQYLASQASPAPKAARPAETGVSAPAR